MAIREFSEADIELLRHWAKYTKGTPISDTIEDAIDTFEELIKRDKENWEDLKKDLAEHLNDILDTTKGNISNYLRS